ncbi:MAG: hypothetical protein AAGB51_07445 [Planctomycetota bacterium]
MDSRIIAAFAACAVAAPSLGVSTVDPRLDQLMIGGGSLTSADLDPKSQDYPAYPVLKFDLNQLQFELDSVLTESYSGSLFIFSGDESTLRSVEGSGSQFGAFTGAGSGGSLGSFSSQIDFSGGEVTGGFIELSNDIGDSLSIQLSAAGQVRGTAGSGFFIDGLHAGSGFDSADQFFGDVDLAEFYSTSGPLSDTLIGDLLIHRIPGGTTGGTLDAEIVVLVPGPGALAAFGTIAMLGTRRRRS